MSTIRYDVVNAAISRANNLIDYSIHDDFHKQHEFKKQTIFADESLTNDEKTLAVRLINKSYDRDKIIFNEGARRICENCNKECLATLYCEYCVRNYLKAKFSDWTSGNDEIDKLIQKCQMETLMPILVVEWIPYNKLQNIKYLTKGGFSEIYTADWIDGCYFEWDAKKQQLTRENEGKTQAVALKRLENVESANQNWLEEAKSHLTISSKYFEVVQCFGLTQDPSNGNYMLVMDKMDMDLRTYLQKNHNQLMWKERIKITFLIVKKLYVIHKENVIHRDLHSGNILYSQHADRWQISDLGFCGPADKPSKSIYGNLPYIAPEVISGREYTFVSDIYSIGMLMWEISSCQPPFIEYEHNFDLVMNIINGMRPKIVSGTPSEYENLMKQCWDADPLKRPNAYTLGIKIRDMHALCNQNKFVEPFQPKTNSNLNSTNSSKLFSKLFTSKVHKFENLPEPRNATEEEQEEFYRDSKMYNISIPDNNDDFEKSSNQSSSKSSVFKAGSKSLSKVFEKLQIKNDE